VKCEIIPQLGVHRIWIRIRPDPMLLDPAGIWIRPDPMFLDPVRIRIRPHPR